MNWADSRLQCVSRGSDLATIKSSFDNTLLYNLATSWLNCWIGLHDHDIENTFVWADGSDNSYRNWDVNQPDNLGGIQDCTLMWGGGYWDDDFCSLTSRSCYFCGTEGKHFEYCMCMLCIMLVRVTRSHNVIYPVHMWYTCYTVFRLLPKGMWEYTLVWVY